MSLFAVLLATLAAELATPAGGLLGRLVHPGRGAVHQGLLRTSVAVGGGLLFAAVALVLVPQGLAALALGPALACLLGGAVLFMAADRAIERRGGRAAQVMASTLDSVPEALGFGAAFAAGTGVGPVLVLLVGLQNLPEGFNGYLELRTSGWRVGSAFAVLAGTSLLGVLAAVLGYLYLGPHPVLVGGLFLASAGGILYLLVQDIAPLAHKDGHWAPALGAVAGFGIGIAAQALVG